MSASVLFDAPGPRARARQRLIAIIGAVVIAAFLAFAVWKLGEKGNLAGDRWSPFGTASMWQDYLLPGLVNTLKAAGISIVTALVFGVVFGMARLSPVKPVRWVATVVVEFFRSVPVLIMMITAFWAYSYSTWFTDTFGFEMAPLAAVVTGLTFYNGSVVAELLRSGVGSLPKGQSEAGLSIGLTEGQTLRTILLPQAVTAMLPALVSQLVVILKDTALGAIITYPELLNQYKNIGSNWSNPVPAILFIAVLFILINYALTSAASALESRLRNRGRTTIKPGAGPGGVNPVDESAVNVALHQADDRALHEKDGHDPRKD